MYVPYCGECPHHKSSSQFTFAHTNLHLRLRLGVIQTFGIEFILHHVPVRIRTNVQSNLDNVTLVYRTP